MSIFVDVALSGVDANITSEVSYALKFQTLQKIDWKTSKKLMFGNLLAISLGCDFRNIIWAYVKDRDYLQNNIIVVNLCKLQDSFDHGQVIHVCWRKILIDNELTFLNLLLFRN